MDADKITKIVTQEWPESNEAQHNLRKKNRLYPQYRPCLAPKHELVTWKQKHQSAVRRIHQNEIAMYAQK